MLDGEQFNLWHWDSLGVYAATSREPFTLKVESWVRLIDVVRDAGWLVPREFVASGEIGHTIT